MYVDFGSGEVDFDYYPTWAGRERIIAVTPDQAASFGIGQQCLFPGSSERNN